MSVRVELVEVHRFGHRAPEFVHEGAGQKQQHAFAADRAFHRDALKAPAPRREAMAAGRSPRTAMKPILWRLPA